MVTLNKTPKVDVITTIQIYVYVFSAMLHFSNNTAKFIWLGILHIKCPISRLVNYLPHCKTELTL